MKGREQLIWRIVLIAFAAGLLVWGFAVFLQVRRLAGWRRDLVAGGFPKDYATALAELKWEHPNWSFEPLIVGDLSWNEVVERECSPAWNLISSLEQLKPYRAENAKSYDSGAWYQASRETVAFFMDPRNFLNETDIFMFESLRSGAAARSEELVEKMLSRTFMAHAGVDGGSKTFARLLIEIGERRGISPAFLAGRLASEQGMGSVQARGVIGDSLFEMSTNKEGRVGAAVVWGPTYTYKGKKTAAVLAKGREAYNGYYNFFNIGAYGSGLFEIRYNAWREAVSKDVVEKYCGPWNTQARAIEGGAIRIKERYIDTQRHTRYLQKFSVSPKAGPFRWKQYMQNIGAPLSEARNTTAAYASAEALDAAYHFVIPVYRGMPAKLCADPAEGCSMYGPVRK